MLRHGRNTFDDDSVRRIGETVQEAEAARKIGSGRQAEPGRQLPPTEIAVKLTEDVGATTAGEASAIKKRWDPTADDGEGDYVDTEEEIIVRDTLGIFATATEDSEGWARALPKGDGTPCWELRQLSCDT